MSMFGSDKINNESDLDYNRRRQKEDRIWNEAIEAVVKLINDNNNYDVTACAMKDEIRRLRQRDVPNPIEFDRSEAHLLMLYLQEHLK